MNVKKILAVMTVAVLAVALPSLGGERVVCKVWLDDGGVVARSTALTPTALIGVRPNTAGLGYSTLDGKSCPSDRLQPDGGIVAWDAGTSFALTNADGTAADGGRAGCPLCDFRGATSLVLQCKDPVYYSEKWDGGVDQWNQRGVTPATSNDVLVDFDMNPDGYRIDFRGSASGKNNHLSIKPVSASATNFCTLSTIERKSP
jgi:hypothetical protein